MDHTSIQWSYTHGIKLPSILASLQGIYPRYAHCIYYLGTTKHFTYLGQCFCAPNHQSGMKVFAIAICNTIDEHTIV